MGTSFLPGAQTLDTAAYVNPADAPEPDGTHAWDATTMILVTARAGDVSGIGWSYAAAAAQAVVTDVLAGAVSRSDPDRTGLGMDLRTADAERYRRG